MSKEIPLRNDHTVYVLGAGYSVHRGLPLISNFLNSMRDAALWCESNGRDSEARAIHEVLKFRLDAAAAAYRVPIDLENIEELFSLSSASDPRILESVKLSICATLNYCIGINAPSHLIFGAYDSDGSRYRNYSEGDGIGGNGLKFDLYDALALDVLRCLDGERSTIITFNYDNLVEKSIQRLGGRFNYGLKADHEFEDGVSYSDKGEGTAVLKLHGSVNWAYSGRSGRTFKVYKDYESVRSNGRVPHIVPPTWNKTIAERLAEVWFKAIEKMSTATQIVIIGFSIPATDLHFKYLLAAGMRSNFSLRKIIFVDPSDGIRARVAGVISEREVEKGRVEFVKSTVEDLIGSRVTPNRFKLRNAGLPF